MATLAGDRSRNDAAETVADQMNAAAGLFSSAIDRFIQSTLDQNVGTLGVESDAGEVWCVTDTAKPGEHLEQINVGAEEAWDHNDAGIVTARHS